MKGGPHLTSRWADAGFESCALKVYSALVELYIGGVDIVYGVVGFQSVQAICVSDAFAHPSEFLSVRVVRQNLDVIGRQDTPESP